MNSPPLPSLETFMRLAIAEAERARGRTGDNPWVGCVIVDDAGTVLGAGATQGPGEDHAEIAAVRQALAAGHRLRGTTLFSTLEPCAFHGRTPSCAKRMVDDGFARVVIGMSDPHPRVNGEGVAILERGGITVVQGVLEADVRQQLGEWVLREHPHDVKARALVLAGSSGQSTLAESEIVSQLAAVYAVPEDAVRSALR